MRRRGRYAFTTRYALCYQHVRRRRRGQADEHGSASADAEDGRSEGLEALAAQGRVPRGKPKVIAFQNILRVGVQKDDPCVLVLETLQREYAFRLSTPAHAEEWAAALCAAAVHADRVWVDEPPAPAAAATPSRSPSHPVASSEGSV